MFEATKLEPVGDGTSRDLGHRVFTSKATFLEAVAAWRAEGFDVHVQWERGPDDAAILAEIDRLGAVSRTTP